MRRAQAQGRGDRGIALLEFALVAVLFFTLLFGIVGFGVVLSFKQTVTQAANEAARRAAVTQNLATTTNDERLDAATDAIDDFEAWGRDCSSPGMTCTRLIVDCGTTTAAIDPAVPDCMHVRLSFDYGNHPIVPNLPFVNSFLPDTVETTATAQLSFPGP